MGLLSPRLAPPIPQAPPRPAPALRTGWSDLDALRVFRPGRLVVLDQPPPRVLYALLAQAAIGRGALHLDGGNRVNAHRLAEAAQRMGVAPERALRGLRLARGFTPYQFQALLEETLPREIGNVDLAVVGGVAEPYLDPDTPRREGWILYRRALRELDRLARASPAPLVLTNEGGALHRSRPHAEMLSSFGMMLSFRQAPGGAWRVRAPRLGVELLVQAEGQRSLEDYAATATLEIPSAPPVLAEA